MRVNGTTENLLKICFVIGKRYGGGSERSLTELANILAEMGYEIVVIQKSKTDTDYPINKKVKVYALEEKSNWFIQKLRLRIVEQWLFIKKIREINPDILVPYLLWAEKVSFWATRIGRRRLIYAIRCNPALYPEHKAERIYRNIRCFFADRIYVQNSGECKYFPPLIQRKIFVLSNIINQDFFEIERTPKEKITHFVNAGRLAPQKNQRILISAFSELVNLNPDKQLHLTIYGKGKLDRELEKLIRQLHMQKHIFLQGFSMDLPKEYLKADAFILTSDYEGQPNVLMEAMAAGLPCISTNCPTGPAELIENEVNGVLIPCGDVSALVVAMQRFVTKPSEADRMGKKAREHMKVICDRERIGQDFIEKCMETRRKK